jgi:hypothetical protein
LNVSIVSTLDGTLDEAADDWAAGRPSSSAI